MHFWDNEKNGKWAYLVEGPSGNVIVLPAAGYRDGSSLIYAGFFGYYWSSSLCEGLSVSARYVRFRSGGVDWSFDDRYYGFSVRPVSE